MEGLLKHRYVNASDDPAAYAADQIGRQAVTAQFAWDHLCDVTLWIYRSEEAEAFGEPWLEITGHDLLKDGKHVLEYGRTGEKFVDSDFRVFAGIFAIEKATGINLHTWFLEAK